MSDALSDWLPNLPNGWQLKPFFSVMSERKQLNRELKETKVLSLSYGEVVVRDVESNQGLLPASFEGYNVVEPGDIVMRLTDLQNDQRSLRTGRVFEKGIITSAYVTVTPSNVFHSRFAHYLLHGYDLAKLFYRMGGGLRQTMNYSDLKKIPLVIPPYFEQERIANFLDEKTARIDALIAEKQKLLDLLKSIISDEVTRAVTTGIDGAPSIKTKLDWCPAVPKHWEILLLKRLFERTEYGISESMNPEGPIGVLRMGNIQEGNVSMLDLKFVDSVEPALLLKKGDVLYNRTNSLALVGKVGLVRELPDVPVTFASYLVRLVPNAKVVPEYLVYLLNCPDVLAIASSLAFPSISQANLNPTRYGYIHVPCPPIGEQRRIVAYLDKKAAATGGLAAHTLKHIDRLREYRSSLISAAVTGQLDVVRFREAA